MTKKKECGICYCKSHQQAECGHYYHKSCLKRYKRFHKQYNYDCFQCQHVTFSDLRKRKKNRKEKSDLDIIKIINSTK